MAFFSQFQRISSVLFRGIHELFIMRRRLVVSAIIAVSSEHSFVSITILTVSDSSFITRIRIYGAPLGILYRKKMSSINITHCHGMQSFFFEITFFWIKENFTFLSRSSRRKLSHLFVFIRIRHSRVRTSIVRYSDTHSVAIIWVFFSVFSFCFVFFYFIFDYM